MNEDGIYPLGWAYDDWKVENNGDILPYLDRLLSAAEEFLSI